MQGLNYLPNTRKSRLPDLEPPELHKQDKLLQSLHRHEDVETLHYLTLLAVIATAWFFR